MAQGMFQAVVPCDEARNPYANAADPMARSLWFVVDPDLADPPQDQVDLKAGVEQALTAIQRLFAAPDREPAFRRFFVQIASAAQVGLVGPKAQPAVAKPALAAAVSDLIDEEGGRIKNAHLRELAGSAWHLSIPVLFLYALMGLAAGQGSALRPYLERLELHPLALNCFLVMLIGCFVGVVLSYAARTTTLTLTDLINPDTDRLRPVVRLAVSAGWTLLLGYFLALGVIELNVGELSTKDFVRQPMLAFLLGAVCGLSNLTLPGAVMKKVGDLMPGK